MQEIQGSGLTQHNIMSSSSKEMEGEGAEKKFLLQKNIKLSRDLALISHHDYL